MSEKEAKPKKSTAVRKALAILERDGRVLPDDVVAAAREKGSPLHKYFEWDDAKAGHAFRLEQARQLIRSVEYKYQLTSDTYITAPVYVRDGESAPTAQGYRVLSEIKDNPEAARAALSLELMRVESLLTRAEAIAGVLGLVDHVQRLVRRTRALRKLVQPRADA